jgi:hypothetical protein
MRQALVALSCAQRTPAGLPAGMPGIGELMEGAMQQAPQPGRQFMGFAIKNIANYARSMWANATIVT